MRTSWHSVSLSRLAGTAHRSPPETDASPAGMMRNEGRQLYHGLGGCAICHGIDGQLSLDGHRLEGSRPSAGYAACPARQSPGSASLTSGTMKTGFSPSARARPRDGHVSQALLRDEEHSDNMRLPRLRASTAGSRTPQQRWCNCGISDRLSAGSNSNRYGNGIPRSPFAAGLSSPGHRHLVGRGVAAAGHSPERRSGERPGASIPWTGVLRQIVGRVGQTDQSHPIEGCGVAAPAWNVAAHAADGCRDSSAGVSSNERPFRSRDPPIAKNPAPARKSSTPSTAKVAIRRQAALRRCLH